MNIFVQQAGLIWQELLITLTPLQGDILDSSLVHHGAAT